MKKNVGIFDRIIRIVLAVLAVVLYVSGAVSGSTAIILGAVALIFLVTGFAGYCPMYGACRISTQHSEPQTKGAE